MLDRFHKIAEIIASIAIVASLLFVGIQVNQNTAAMQNGASYAAQEHWVGITTEMASNRQLAEVWSASLDYPDGMPAPDADQLQVRLMCHAQLKSLEGQFNQYRLGNLSEEVWQNHWKGFLRQLMTQPHYERILNSPEPPYSSAFMLMFRRGMVEAKAIRARLAAG